MVVGTRKPNFFIIGAPKCGTSALSVYLREHASIFFSDPKEPNYFISDFSDRLRKVLKEEEYLRLFDEVENEVAIGEGSVWYLFSKEAVSNILNFNPEAKFIALVRNPIVMLRSFYRELYSNFEEDADSLEEAWGLQEERRRGESIPKVTRDPQVLQYGKVCSLGSQLERLLQQVSPEKVHIIFYDDLKSNTRSVYKGVLDFLGVEDDGRKFFPVINRRERVKYKSLQRITKFLGRVKKTLGIRKSLGLLDSIKRKNKETLEIQPLEPNFRKELQHYFSTDIQKLAVLTGRDLSHWK